MSVFKITYANNKPLSCYWVVGIVVDSDYLEFIDYYLISAFIIADDEVEAMDIAEEIATIFNDQQKLPASIFSYDNLIEELYLL